MQIHLYNNAGLWVFRGGNIVVKGTKEKPVVFQGTRLEQGFKNIAGQWDRILINQGVKNNTFDFTIIKNGFIGLQIEPFNQNPTEVNNNKVILNSCEIINHSLAGIYATNAKIEDKNSIIANCGAFNIFSQGKNQLEFIHTTIANYWNFSIRNTPAVLIKNYYIYNKQNIEFETDSITFTNSIITGDNQDEIEIQKLSNSTKKIKFLIQNSAITHEDDLNKTNGFKNILLNPKKTIFKNVLLPDYSLTPSASVINKGKVTNVKVDHNNNPRNDGSPDLGAFEL